MSRKIFFSILILATIRSLPATTGEPMRFEKVYDGHVTLKIPADWNRIPEEFLELQSLRSAEESGGQTTELYQYGFRPGNPELDFALPQILIQFRESGRVPDGRFLHLPTTEDLQRESEELLSDRAGPLVRGMKLDSVFYDRESHSLRLENVLDYEHEGEVLVESASFLTERGWFTVHCYTRVSERDLTAPLFDRVIASVRFDDELLYRPRLTDRLPRFFMPLLLVAALIAAVLAIVVARHRRRPS
jgi:hypothetical protein